MNQPKQKIQTIAFVVIITSILYYCFAYLLRVYPSVIEPDLMARFHIAAGGLGLLTAFYYFAYAPMQIPVGLTVDRIGARRSLLFACLIAMLGILLFSYSHQYAVALLGRFLIGFGSAFAYVTALKVTSIWLPKKYFATVTGFVTGGGMIAAIATDQSLTYIVQHGSFKTALYTPLLIGALLFVLIFLFVKDKPKQAYIEDADDSDDSEESSAVSFKQLMQFTNKIIRNPQMWIIGIIGALLYLPSTTFLDVWGIPYLENVYNLSPQMAADGVSMMLVGWICSSFVTGYISDLLQNRKLLLILATFGAGIMASIMIFVPGISTTGVMVILFLFGFCCGPHPLCFTLSKENYEHKIAGTAVSFANFVIMMGGFLFQPLIGKVLQLSWHGQMANGIPVYSVNDYTTALSILPIGLFIACFLTFAIRDTLKQGASHITAPTSPNASIAEY